MNYWYAGQWYKEITYSMSLRYCMNQKLKQSKVWSINGFCVRGFVMSFKFFNFIFNLSHSTKICLRVLDGDLVFPIKSATGFNNSINLLLDEKWSRVIISWTYVIIFGYSSEVTCFDLSSIIFFSWADTPRHILIIVHHLASHRACNE